MLYLVKDTLNIMSLIGLILLMGLVSKNAILLVDFTNVQRRAGLSRREALIAAARPVIGWPDHLDPTDPGGGPGDLHLPGQPGAPLRPAPAGTARMD